MATIDRLAIFTGLASLATAALGILLGGATIYLVALVPSLALLTLSIRRRNRLASSAWFAVQVGIGAGGAMAPGYAVFVVALALGYWDLEDFARRLHKASNVQRMESLIRRHLLLLAVALSIGTLTAIAAVAGEIQLGFVAAALGALIVAFGLSYLLGRAGSR
jgi:hypothetical protein